MGHSTVIAFVLFIAASSAVPVRHVKRQTAQDAQVQATSTLVAGLLNFRQITNPGNSDSQLRDFLLETLGESGASDILCNQQLMSSAADCLREELQLFCQWQLYELINRAQQQLLPEEGVSDNRRGWVETQLQGVPNSEVKGYICENYCKYCGGISNCR